MYFRVFSYSYSNEVGYNSPYGYSPTVNNPQNMGGYDISADYVDSTTTYEPRSSIIDSDFIGGHSKYLKVDVDNISNGWTSKLAIANHTKKNCDKRDVSKLG